MDSINNTAIGTGTLLVSVNAVQTAVGMIDGDVSYSEKRQELEVWNKSNIPWTLEKKVVISKTCTLSCASVNMTKVGFLRALPTDGVTVVFVPFESVAPTVTITKSTFKNINIQYRRAGFVVINLEIDGIPS